MSKIICNWDGRSTNYSLSLRGDRCLMTLVRGEDVVTTFLSIETMREMCADFAEALIKMERNHARTNLVQD